MPVLYNVHVLRVIASQQINLNGDATMSENAIDYLIGGYIVVDTVEVD